MNQREREHEIMRIQNAEGKSTSREHFCRLMKTRARRCGGDKLHNFISVLREMEFEYLADQIQFEMLHEPGMPEPRRRVEPSPAATPVAKPKIDFNLNEVF